MIFRQTKRAGRRSRANPDFQQLPYLAVAVAVAGVILFSIFASGAYFVGPLTLAIVSAWLMLIVVLLIDPDEVSALRRRPLLPAAGLFAALWVWTALSLRWSIAPDLTWTEINRTGGFMAFFLLGAMVGRRRLARGVYAFLFLALITVAAAYALGTKTLPGTIDNMNNLGRISVPLQYANAVGLMVALGYPFSLYFAAAKKSFWALRLFAMLAGLILLVTLFFTLSRGSIAALVIGMTIYFAIVPLRLRSAGVMALSLAPTALIGLWASGQAALMDNNKPLAARLAAAATLRADLALAAAAAVIIFVAALLAGRRVTFPPRMCRLAGGFLIGALVLTLVASAAWFVSSKPSFSQWARNTYQSFKSQPATSDASRLFELNSRARWMIWQVAIANWEQHPVIGTGAQTFPLVYMMQRQQGLIFVKQPHGLDFRLLSELGLVGFGLMAGFIVVTMSYATSIAVRLKDRWDRALAGTMLAAVVIYLIHTAFDWDWNMAVLTIIYAFFIGILMGWAGTLPASLPARTGRGKGNMQDL